MKKSMKKLQLCRETLGTLTVEQSQQVAGGTSILCDPPFTSDSVRFCCADM